MAHGLKYKWYGQRLDEYRSTVYSTLYILEKDYAGVVKEIGDLAGISVGFDGSNKPYAPIIKSTMSINIIDSRDKTDTETTKYGNWEEFYTPDATKYQVILYEGNPNTPDLMTERWRGYATPDSWDEDLEYRGCITITARDNIGMLQNFEFDAAGNTYGLISIGDFMTAAANKISQTFTWDTTTKCMKAHVSIGMATNPSCDLNEVLIDVRTFEGKNWFDALEGLLESIGCCLRWQDYGSYLISAIYRIQSAGIHSHSEKDIIFANCSGHRTLKPALKEIIDTITFDVRNEESLLPSGYQRRDFDDREAYILDDTKWKSYVNVNFIRTLSPYTETYKRSSWASPDTLLIRTSYAWGNDYFYRDFICPPSTKVTLSFDVRNVGVYYLNELNVTEHRALGLIRIFLGIIWKPYDTSSSWKYLVWNGQMQALEWTTTQPEGMERLYGDFAQGSSYEHSDTTFTVPNDAGHLEVRFYSVQAPNAPQTDDTSRCFAKLFNIKLDFESGSSLYKKHTVTTVNNTSYNETMKRSPMIAQYPGGSIYAGIIVNTFYFPRLYSSYPGGFPSVMGWTRYGDSTGWTAWQNLSELIHKQLLCLQGAPMSEFSGELLQIGNNPHFNNKFMYSDKKCFITGGTLDIVSGSIQSTYLSEYLDWEDVWEE